MAFRMFSSLAVASLALGTLTVTTTGCAEEGQPVFTDADSSVLVERVNLGGPPTTCAADSTRRYTYDRKTRTLVWVRCSESASDSERMEAPAKSRVLDTSDAQRVEDVLASIRYTEHPPCGGYDGRETFMKVGAETYSAANINCYGYKLAPRIDMLFDLARSLPL